MLTHLLIGVAFITVFALIELHYQDKLIPMLQAIIYVLGVLFIFALCTPFFLIGEIREWRIRRKVARMKGSCERGWAEETIYHN